MRLEDALLSNGEYVNDHLNIRLYIYLKCTSNDFQEKLLRDACFGC